MCGLLDAHFEDPTPNYNPIGLVSNRVHDESTTAVQDQGFDDCWSSSDLDDTSVPAVTTPAHNMLTRPKVGIRRPNPKYVLQVSDTPFISRNVQTVLGLPEWKKAMCSEIEALG